MAPLSNNQNSLYFSRALVPAMNYSRREERRAMPIRSSRAGDPFPIPVTRHMLRGPSSPGFTTQSIPTIDPKFPLQRLTLESAVAPLIPRPTAPFAKSERKRALTSAAYYSECCMNGISPVEADKAALAVQSQYNKWWVGAKYHETGDTEGPSELKRRKLREEPQSSQQPSRDVKQTTLKTNDAYVTSEDESYISKTNSQQGSLRDMGESVSIREITLSAEVNANEISAIKNTLTAELTATGGDSTTAKFEKCLNLLHSSYKSRGWDARWLEKDSSPFSLDGTWLTLTKPTYTECKGRNPKGQYIYSLGRLTFDMFRPSGLICSVQGVFNSISVTDCSECKRLGSIPWRLRNDVSGNPGSPAVRNYDITVAFTVEANQTRRGERPGPAQEADGEYIVRKPIRSLLTNRGYCVPDPDVPNRLSIWFSSGRLEVQDETEDLAEWRHLFDEKEAPRRSIGELARVVAAKVLLGADIASEMNEDGTLSYNLKRPIGGHSQVFCDVLYADDTMRIVRGHHGSTFVFSRVPSFSSND